MRCDICNSVTTPGVFNKRTRMFDTTCPACAGAIRECVEFDNLLDNVEQTWDNRHRDVPKKVSQEET